MIQATYRRTGLIPECVYEKPCLDEFIVLERFDEQVHVMLYPKRFVEATVQILRDSANVWCTDFEELWMVEDLLNKTFRDKPRRKPFKQPKIQLQVGECRKILETPLGLLAASFYYHGREIAEMVHYALESMEKRPW
jgi:hypothetical protein